MEKKQYFKRYTKRNGTRKEEKQKKFLQEIQQIILQMEFQRKRKNIQNCLKA